MEMKSILSIQSVHDNAQNVNQIINFAQVNKLHLDMVILAPIVRPYVSVDGVIMNDITFAENKELSKKSHALKEQIIQAGDRQGISMSVVVEIADIALFDRILERYANCSDCLVLSQSLMMQNDLVKRSFVHILRDNSCPAILLVGEGPIFQDLTNVMIAWDGGVAAAAAIRDAIPILQQAKNISLVCVDPSPDETGDIPGDDMAHYLVRHKIDVIVELIPSAGQSIAQALFQKAKDMDADLVIMGGYGRSRLREWILGGTTSDTLSLASCSVFMAHG